MRQRRQKPEIKARIKEQCARYRTTPEGAAKRAAYRKTDKMKAARKRWKESEAGRAYEAAYRKTEMRKRVSARYAASEKGKAVIRRSWQTPQGRERLLRGCHKRRHLLMETISTLTLQEWEEIKARQNYQCAYCGEKKPLTRDHVIPLSKGGHHTKENVVGACRRCNSSKGNRTNWQRPQI